MGIDHVLAVVPVTDIERARAWYERLFGREPENNPMDTLVEWRVTDAGWVQVTVHAERAGHTLLNFAVDDLATHLAALRDRGMETESPQEVKKGVQLSPVTDPDGNTITFIGRFRVSY